MAEKQEIELLGEKIRAPDAAPKVAVTTPREVWEDLSTCSAPLQFSSRVNVEEDLMRKQLEELKNRFDKVQLKLNEKDGIVLSLKESLRSMNIKYEGKCNELERLLAEDRMMDKTLNNITVENGILNICVSKLRETQHQTSVEFSRLRSDLVAQAQKSNKLEDTVNEKSLVIEDLQRTKAKLEDSVRRLQAVEMTMKAEKHQVGATINQLDSKCKHIQATLVASRSQIDEQLTENQQLHQHLEEASTKIHQLEQMNEHEQKTNRDLISRYESLLKEKNELISSLQLKEEEKAQLPFHGASFQNPQLENEFGKPLSAADTFKPKDSLLLPTSSNNSNKEDINAQSGSIKRPRLFNWIDKQQTKEKQSISAQQTVAVVTRPEEPSNNRELCCFCQTPPYGMMTRCNRSCGRQAHSGCATNNGGTKVLTKGIQFVCKPCAGKT